jgi:hypothetical protein
MEEQLRARKGQAAAVAAVAIARSAKLERVSWRENSSTGRAATRKTHEWIL